MNMTFKFCKPIVVKRSAEGVQKTEIGLGELLQSQAVRTDIKANISRKNADIPNALQHSAIFQRDGFSFESLEY